MSSTVAKILDALAEEHGLAAVLRQVRGWTGTQDARAFLAANPSFRAPAASAPPTAALTQLQEDYASADESTSSGSDTGGKKLPFNFNRLVKELQLPAGHLVHFEARDLDNNLYSVDVPLQEEGGKLVLMLEGHEERGPTPVAARLKMLKGNFKDDPKHGEKHVPYSSHREWSLMDGAKPYKLADKHWATRVWDAASGAFKDRA
jgi:hypothetical protein